MWGFRVNFRIFPDFFLLTFNFIFFIYLINHMTVIYSSSDTIKLVELFIIKEKSWVILFCRVGYIQFGESRKLQFNHGSPNDKTVLISLNIIIICPIIIGPTLIAESSKVLPLTDPCLSPMRSFESLPGMWESYQWLWVRWWSSGFLHYSRLFMHKWVAIWQKNCG